MTAHILNAGASRGPRSFNAPVNMKMMLKKLKKKATFYHTHEETGQSENPFYSFLRETYIYLSIVGLSSHVEL